MLRSLAIVLMCLPIFAHASQPEEFYRSLFLNQKKISATIFNKLLIPDDTVKIPAIIVMKNQADLSKASEFDTKAEKNAYVVKELWDLAKIDQEDIVKFLASQRGLEFRQFYIFNGIALFNPEKNLLLEIAERDDVEKVYFNPTVRNDVAEEVSALNSLITDFTGRNNKKGDPRVELGISHTKAPILWERGITGKGVVVGIQDTGIDQKHPAISKKYRGYSEEALDHSFSWHDSIHSQISSSRSSCGYESKEPCDDNGHGTHVTGTITGDDGEDNKIGMAPDAKWIGCRNMDAGDGSPATYIECYEFFLAPYQQGINPLDNFNNLKPELSADVISNSWGCPRVEGCDKDEILLAVKSIKAAGIFNVVSAGNEGRGGCATIGSQPATLTEYSFTVGALNAANDSIASFSSKGPSIYTNKQGPDVVAPGVNVRSSVPNGGYSSFSGTSMAGPHVAGMITLLLSGKTELKGEIDKVTKAVKESTKGLTATTECGGEKPRSIPNNTFGHGTINAAKAYEKLR